uniref:SET domain-containing protein n=1 Tax=Chromera velia CCMP2878 TaxID=1169474 RepID=A0A0G4FNR7_9ALVE|eukprot:Cvel_17799.t1-p1 / transcript=Cvel_17799.t1 / gene=Cvel_17799 / organism=Chromera_velia_CCMP2878 / gene_product=hypothetical protein / transcript_product=hypothetical protein / location=Cvel_scaffold1441:32877-33380(-) / protein_length=168 / sequence_SO=supercontig / SO=protein_coding / is_pseudo=false
MSYNRSTRRRDPRPEIATLGNGCVVAKSSLHKAGRGLIAARDGIQFEGEWLTEDEADSLTLEERHFYAAKPGRGGRGILGVSDPRQAIGRGAAQFANHVSQGNPRLNARLVYVKDDSTIYLKLLKDVKKGDELFVCYERDYWKDMAHGQSLSASEMCAVNSVAVSPSV